VILLIVAFCLVNFLPHQTHRIYYDEDIYANVGQNMALTGKTGYCNYGTFEYGEYYPHWISYNKEPSGWPFLISLSFQLFGVDEAYAFLLNNLLFSMGVLIAFFITWQVTGLFLPAFLAGTAYMLIPHNLIWSNTAAAEPSAAVLVGLSVLCVVIYLKGRRTRHLFVMGTIIPLACQMRPESMMILLWVFPAILVVFPKAFVDRRLWTMGLLTTLFLLPHLLHFYGVSGHSWGAQGSRFSSEFLLHNLDTNGMYYLNNKSFPLLITILALVGLFCARNRRWQWLIFFWFLPFWGIFLFFYAGSYQYGADVRFALISFMPIAVLAGMGGGWIGEKVMGVERAAGKKMLVSGFIILVLAFGFLKFMPLVRRVGQEAWGSRYDHQYAKMFVDMLPERSIVLTQNPTMLLLWQQNAIQTYAGINNPKLIKTLLEKYRGHVYFHYNYWCNTQNKRNIRLCRDIRDRYDLEKIAEETEQNYRYGIYKITPKNSP
ncbi:MAG: hypothetical protein GY846_20270, partial [Deltaproteobacteria bacterium]|nr:hypothetical protein [Deltaproteobacteria bacterium]